MTSLAPRSVGGCRARCVPLTLVVTALLAAVPTSATAQNSTATEPPVAEGASIRFLTPGTTTPVKGRLVSFDESGLVYRAGDGREVRLAADDVQALETVRLRRHTLEGMLIGGLGGGLLLGSILAATHDGNDFIFDRSDVFFIGGGLGALGGGIVGAVIGHNMVSESWEPVVRPWSGGRPGRLGLGVRLRF